MSEEKNRYWSAWCGTYVHVRHGDIIDNPRYPWTIPALEIPELEIPALVSGEYNERCEKTTRYV